MKFWAFQPEVGVTSLLNHKMSKMYQEGKGDYVYDKSVLEWMNKGSNMQWKKKRKERS